MNFFRNLTRRKPTVRRCIVVLLLILLFAGCDDEQEDTGFVLEGVWSTSYDSYTITKTTVEYFADNSAYGGGNTILNGNIEKSVAFSSNAGVLIILVTTAQNDYPTFSVGNYTGVYYSEGTKNSINLANAYDTSSYNPVEANSLTDAEALFTVDNVSNHVSLWGKYTK